MSGWKKLASAAAASGAALNVEDVFSTYLWEGTSSALDITNNIDFTGEGGMLWIKPRSVSSSHWIQDTERGAGKTLRTNVTDGELDLSSSQPDLHFSSDGFGVAAGTELNYNGQDMVSWSFRKAPKFFDVVTYTGTGSAQTISHNLGTTPAVVIVKMTSNIGGWFVYHSSVGATKYLRLETTGAAITNSTIWNDTAPTDTQFTVGTSGGVNQSGGTYVAYLFAHNDGDGDFGPTGDQDIIKCGSYIGAGSTGPTVDVGFEPQWLLVKAAGTSSEWWLFDNMRGLTPYTDEVLYPNASNAGESRNYFEITSTGFKIKSGTVSSSGTQYIYIAIRRPTGVPESATDVFNPFTYTGTNAARTLDVGFPMDAAFIINRNKNWTYSNWAIDRLRGMTKQVYTDINNAEASDGTYKKIDNMVGLEFTSGGNLNGSTSANYVGYFYKRAPNFFDAVTYTGTSAFSTTIDHNLGTAPEMMWIKNRNVGEEWSVYHKAIGTYYGPSGTTGGVLSLSSSSAVTDTGVNSSSYWRGVPDENAFYLGAQNRVCGSGNTYIAYLFASLDGVSKVGSYTGNGSTQTINCGFSGGARYVMIKRTDSAGDWYVWDSSRGIVAGNDPHSAYNVSGPTAEVTTDDSVDPVSSGFAVNQVGVTNINVSSATYIYHAIA